MARKPDPQGGQFGTAAYDATMHPANAETQAIIAGRLQQARDIHTFGGKGAAAEAFSHVYQGSPNPVAVALMGLAMQRDMIERTVQRVNDQPFPGVPLGHTPGFHRAPDTSPMVGRIGPHGHHAHQSEPEARTRRRFGR